MGAPLNGVTAEDRLAQVVAFRNMAAQLKETWHDQYLDEHHSLMLSVVIWFQEFLKSEPHDFWDRCFAHLQRSVEEDALRLWMGYPEDWQVPVALRGPGVDAGRAVYLGPWVFQPVRTQPRGPILAGAALAGGLTAAEVARTCGAANTYARGAVHGPDGEPPVFLEGWHRVYRRPMPSRAAVERAMRMCVLGRLAGRRLATSKDLLIAEGQAFLRWAVVHDGGSALSAEAMGVMRALILDNEFVVLVHQLPRRQDITDLARRREAEAAWPEPQRAAA